MNQYAFVTGISVHNDSQLLNKLWMAAHYEVNKSLPFVLLHGMTARWSSPPFMLPHIDMHWCHDGPTGLVMIGYDLLGSQGSKGKCWRERELEKKPALEFSTWILGCRRLQAGASSALNPHSSNELHAPVDAYIMEPCFCPWVKDYAYNCLAPCSQFDPEWAALF